MVGTPVQNNLKELLALLGFCNPQLFDDVDGDDFASWYKDPVDQEYLAELIRPQDFILLMKGHLFLINCF